MRGVGGGGLTLDQPPVKQVLRLLPASIKDGRGGEVDEEGGGWKGRRGGRSEEWGGWEGMRGGRREEGDEVRGQGVRREGEDGRG